MEQLKITFVRNIFLLVSSILLIAGCATPTTVLVDIDRPQLNLPPVDVLQLDSVDWLIITEDNYKQVFDALKKQGLNPVIFGLSENGYKRLAINTAKIRSMISQQKSVMEAYRLYYIEEDVARQEAKLNETKKAKEEASKPWWERIGKNNPDVQIKTVTPTTKTQAMPAAPPAKPVLPPSPTTSKSIIVPPVRPITLK